MSPRTSLSVLLPAIAGVAGFVAAGTAAAPATGADRAELRGLLTAPDRQAGRQRLRVTVRVVAPSATWSLRAGTRSIAAERGGACPARVRFTPALTTTAPGRPTGVRGRLPAHRFDTARAATTTVRFSGGAVQGDFLVGLAGDRVRGRLAAAGGVVHGIPDATRLRSVELDATGSLAAGCSAEERAAVLEELAAVLDGSPLHWR